MTDDLTQQLAELIDKRQRFGYRSPYDIARAVLACGLVVPTSDVLNLAQQHGDSETEGRCICGFWMVESTAEHIRAELRALTQQEPR